jgi:DNA-directed RNA polymerase subunit RPC12/RpoP
MSYPMTRCREFKAGRRGRYRTYKCWGCGESFQTPDILVNPLPKDKRICPSCRSKAERDLDLVVMVSVRQGIYWRPDVGVYLNDLDYWKYKEFEEAQ